MKMNRYVRVLRTGLMLVSAILLSLAPPCFSQAVQPDFAVLKGPFLGQDPPGKNPGLFAPSFISAGMAELNSVLSSDGSEFYFCVRTFQASYLFRMRMKDGAKNLMIFIMLAILIIIGEDYMSTTCRITQLFLQNTHPGC